MSLLHTHFCLAPNITSQEAQKIIENTIYKDVRDILVRQHAKLLAVCNHLGIHSACVVDNAADELASTSFTLWSAGKLPVHGILFLRDTEFPKSIAQRIQDIAPDLVLMDYDLGNGYGTDVIRSVKKSAPPPICIGCSSLCQKEQRFMEAGADGFATKQSSIQMQFFVDSLTECLLKISNCRTS